MKTKYAYEGQGSGTLSRYRAPTTIEGPTMKDGSKRGRKAAPKDYGKSASVKQSESRSFQKGGKKSKK